MKIKLLTARVSGMTVHEPGAVVDLPEAEAQALIRGMAAEPIEAAVRVPPETASRRPARR